VTPVVERTGAAAQMSTWSSTLSPGPLSLAQVACAEAPGATKQMPICRLEVAAESRWPMS